MGDRKGQQGGSRKALEVWTGEKNSRGGRLELLADSQVDLGTFQRPLPFWFRALTTRRQSVRLRGEREESWLRRSRSHGSTGVV